MSPSPSEITPADFKAQLSSLGRGIPAQQLLRIFTFGVVIATLGLGWVGIHLPWHTKRLQWIQRHHEEVQRGQLLSEILRIQKSAASDLEGFVFDADAPALTQEISRLAAGAGIQIESVTPKPTLDFGVYQKLQIEVTANASYASMIQFLHAIETHRPFLHIDHLNAGEAPRDERVLLLSRTPGLLPPKVERPKKAQPATFLISAFYKEGPGS